VTNPNNPYWQVDPITGQQVQPGTPQYGGYGGYGQPGGGYGQVGPGYQMPPPGPPKPNRTPLIVAAIVFVVAVVGVVTTLFLVNNGNNKHDASGPRTSVQPTSHSTPTAASTSLSPEGDVPTSPVIPGFQGVKSQRDGAAYDVPADWKVETPDTLTGFEDNNGKPVAVIHAVSTYKPDACPNDPGSYRAHVGFASAGQVDPRTAAKGEAKIMADGAAINDDGSRSPVTVSEATATKVDQGTIDAMTATATVTETSQSGQCTAPSQVITTVAFSTGANTALFVYYGDQGVADALPDAVLQQVISSLRPVG
jgi:hypothetical protein